jgi:hypothetical protein
LKLLILKILPVTRSEDPEPAILALKMLTGSRLRFRKIITEAAREKVSSCALSLQQAN